MSPRFPVALRSALARLRAGAEPNDVAADLIRRRMEGVVLRAELPADDPRRTHLEALVLALEARTFDDSALSLEDVLRDLREEADPVAATACAGRTGSLQSPPCRGSPSKTAKSLSSTSNVEHCGVCGTLRRASSTRAVGGSTSQRRLVRIGSAIRSDQRRSRSLRRRGTSPESRILPSPGSSSCRPAVVASWIPSGSLTRSWHRGSALPASGAPRR